MARRRVSASGTSEQHQKKIMKHSHGGYGGRTLINRIEAQMDKRRKVLEDKVIELGLAASQNSDYLLNKGRYEGFAATLAILRSSSVTEEVNRSNERLGIE